MSKHWAKVRSDVVTSERMNHMLETDAFAYALYMNAKATSDDFGRIPADPRKFKAKAAPMCDKPLSDFSHAINSMIACGVVELYEVGGDKFLQIVAYNSIEATNWQLVGLPECPHPEGWVAPPELCQTIIDSLEKAVATKKRSKCVPSRYGLSTCHFGAYEEHMKSIVRAYSSTSTSFSSESVVVDVPSDGNPTDPFAAIAAYPDEDELAAQQRKTMGSDHSPLTAAVRNFWRDGRAPGGNDNWRGQLIAAVNIEAKQPDALTEAEIVAAFGKYPPLPNEWPDAWVARVRLMTRGDPRKKPKRLSNEPADRSTFHEGPLDELDEAG